VNPSPKPTYAQTLLVVGAAITVAGGILLLWSLGYLPGLGNLWPLPFLLAGLFMLFLAYVRGKSKRFIIPGMILSLGGTFFLLLNTILREKGMERIWPFFMLITGLSLIPYGMREKGAARTAIIIPGIFIAVLSLTFLPFSLGATGIGFRAFVQEWWPLILVGLGLAFIASFFSAGKPTNKV
jgi:hypothetical protein